MNFYRKEKFSFNFYLKNIEKRNTLQWEKRGRKAPEDKELYKEEEVNEEEAVKTEEEQ